MQCGPWWTSFYSGMKLQFHPYELILSLGFFFFFIPHHLSLRFTMAKTILDNINTHFLLHENNIETLLKV